MPSASDLKERVRLQKRSGTKDGYGNVVPGPWQDQFDRRAQFIMKPGSEAVLAARLQGQQPVTIIVRFDSQTSTIGTDWRVIDVRTGTALAIKAAEDMDRKRQWWTMVCAAGEVT